jgi:hypothetical protein
VNGLRARMGRGAALRTGTTGTTGARIRKRGRPLHGSWFALVCGALLAYGVVRVWRAQQWLQAQGEASSRILVDEAAPGQHLTFGTFENVQSYRVAVHAVGDLGMLAEQRRNPRPVHLRFHVGELIHEVDLMLPGQATRVAVEETGLVVGDPVFVNLPGALARHAFSVEIGAISSARGVAMRVYRGELLSASAAHKRMDMLASHRKTVLAASHWELDFVDLEPMTQDALARIRFRKAAAENARFTHAIALAPWVAPPSPATHFPRIGTFMLEAGQVLSLGTMGPNDLEIVTEPAAVSLRATLRAASEVPTATIPDGVPLEVTRSGNDGAQGLSIPSATGALELVAEKPCTLLLRAREPARLQPPTLLRPYRLEAGASMDWTVIEVARVFRIGARPVGY